MKNPRLIETGYQSPQLKLWMLGTDRMAARAFSCLATQRGKSRKVRRWSSNFLFRLSIQTPSLIPSAEQKDGDSWYYQGMSTYQIDPRIDDYIQTLSAWQQEICRQVRDLVHAADPEVTETIKRTKLPYFTLNGNICALLGAKDHLNIFIYDPLAPDPEGMINQGQGNLTARAIQVRQGETINKDALLNLFQAVIANNRAGGWRKLKGSQ
ncbi:MAG TPA: DUF1801 domain-containing protein [Ktedonosporobacter sp.]|nr:DUF1801 domain-containing protein [Ktedonosporobacter sp.]